MGETGGARPHITCSKTGFLQVYNTMPRINIVGYKVPVPGHPLLRMALGAMMVMGGVLGFLPVLGFWMVPVGLAILAVDFPPVRRFQRRMTVKLGHWLHERWPRIAARFGYGLRRESRNVGESESTD